MSEEENQESSKPKGKGGASKILVLGLLLCNVLSLAGLGAFMLLGGSSESAAAADMGSATKGDAESAGEKSAGKDSAADGKEAGKDGEASDGDDFAGSAGDLGPTVKLGSFVINLNDPGHPRYLKVTLKAELSATTAKNEVRAREPQIRDIIISYLSSLALKETYGARAKATIRDNIQRRLNHILTTGEVTRVFFTDFMTQ